MFNDVSDLVIVMSDAFAGADAVGHLACPVPLRGRRGVVPGGPEVEGGR
jgi:hypothetical protein